MSLSALPGRRPWFVSGAACLLAGMMAQAGAATELADKLPYLHVVYNLGSNTPVRVYGGKVALDLTTEKRWEQVLGELKELGVNVITPLTSYGPHTIYPTGLAELDQCAGWATRRLDGLKMALAACRKLDLACYPAVWLYRAATPDLCEKTTRELFALYGTHPAFAGFVPPVEANPRSGMQSDDFIRLARLAKKLKPGVVVMDYPNGPFSFAVMRTITTRSLSGAVDFENVQFHPSDQRWHGDFEYARGLFHLVHGLCPGVGWIVHTHYKYGGGKRWIELTDLYRVTQAATLTASPYGTSIFSFLHAMWGNASSTNGDDPRERRLAWYEGILNVQRLLPYYHRAQPANAVAVMIPRHLRESSDSLLRTTYLPLRQSGVACHFFLDEKNLGVGVQAVIVPALSDCSPRQLRLLQKFVAAGGALLVLQAPAPASPDDLSPRAKRILGLAATPTWQTPRIDPAFAKALHLDPATGRVNATGRRVNDYGRGRVTVLPYTDPAALAHSLRDWADTGAPQRLVVRPAPAGFTVDTWSKSTPRGPVRLVMLLGTRKGAHARNVTVTVPPPPAGCRWTSAWLLEPDRRPTRLSVVRQGRRLLVVIPGLTDEYNALLFAGDAPPLLVPAARLVRIRKSAGRVSYAFSLANPSPRRLTTVVRVVPPPEWHRSDPAIVPAVFKVDLPAGGVVARNGSFPVPASLTRKPYFLRYECGDSIQRTIVYPEAGAPQTFTDLSPERIAALAKKQTAAQHLAPRPLGPDWVGVRADDPHAADPAACRPGICFLPGREWDPPAEHEGKVARYGERLPRAGAPNFLVNEPPPGDLEIRLTYWSRSGGTMNLYDGKRYRRIAVLPPTRKWSQLTARVPAALLATPGIDRTSYPGVNVLFDLDCASVFVHRLEARAAGR